MRERRPVGEFLETLSHLVVGQDVEEAVLDAPLPQESYQLPREPALRRAGRALHEEHDWRGTDELAQALPELLLRLDRILLRLGNLYRRFICRCSSCAVRCIRAYAVGVLAIFRVLLDRRPDLDRATAANSLEHLVVALEHEVRDRGHLVRLRNVAQLLSVNRHPARRLIVLGILGGKRLEHRGHLRARCRPRRVEGDYEERGRREGGDVGSPLVPCLDLFYRRHDGWSCCSDNFSVLLLFLIFQGFRPCNRGSPKADGPMWRRLWRQGFEECNGCNEWLKVRQKFCLIWDWIVS